MLGPFLGQAIYSAIDFEFTFYVFAGIIAPFMVLCFFWIPQSLNRGKVNGVDDKELAAGMMGAGHEGAPVQSK